MRKNATDWTGYRYSYLTITGPSEEKDGHGRVKWLAKCTCGVTKPMDIRDIRKKERAGRPISCGCMRRELIAQSRTTHGMTSHSAYGVWHSMVQRCTEPTHRAWKNYGGRGITVCERWLHDFGAFWLDMGATYKQGLDLDRKDNEKGYSPENCRWVTRSVNNRNKRNARHVIFWGREMTVKELSEKSGIKYTTLLYRLDHGCPLERLIDEPDLTNRFTT